jgi:bacillithiol biosynthesis cysteine-adding enzyme BshC
MHQSLINFKETGYFSKLILDYIEGNPILQPFFKYLPEPQSFKQVILDKQTEGTDRTLLASVLNDQNKIFKAFEVLQKNIELINDVKTFTVTTGHQLCLFTGPLYFLYKIITTIALATTLKKSYPEYNFVPIYWMASEDHDFEEVNHIHLYGKKIVWDQDQKGAMGGIPVHSITNLIEELKPLMGTSENAINLLAIFETAYSRSNLAEATRYLVSTLFGPYGLVTLDASDARLKNTFSSILKADLFENKTFDLVNETIGLLSEHQYKIQVNPRQINCFYMHDGLRARIEKSGTEFHVVNTTIRFTEQELLKELEDHPERFSPNVVLRPLYQEKILPNLAYIGGPGELVYWLEYKKAFDFYGINFPVLMLRNCYLLVDASQNERLQKNNVHANELFAPVEELIKAMAKRSGGDLDFSNEEDQLIALFEGIREKAGKTDITLKGMVEAELQKQVNALKNIESKVLKAEKQKQEVAINQIRKIRDKLFPNDKLQERHDNFIPYYIKYGPEFIHELIAEADPFIKEFTILTK